MDGSWGTTTVDEEEEVLQTPKDKDNGTKLKKEPFKCRRWSYTGYLYVHL